MKAAYLLQYFVRHVDKNQTEDFLPWKGYNVYQSDLVSWESCRRWLKKRTASGNPAAAGIHEQAG